jgi:tetratricopeptide (TPR) repeat protein
VPGPWLASRAFHHDFTTSFLIFTAIVNIHHFILDGAIWKLRDGRIAAFLLNTRERISESALRAPGHFAAARHWLLGSTRGARALRLGTAMLLLAWGAVDQARYYLALHAEDLADLQQAATLDSFDSSLQMRLARKSMVDGDPEQAEAAWREAIQINPTDQAPRQALLEFLIGQNRLDEAFNLTETSLKYSPRDANLLIDRGLLAQRRGDTSQAIASWNEALAVDGTQPLAHLYLAGELDREGKAQAAASHYRAFLNQIARQKAQDRPQPDRVIAVALRMADCQSRSAQLELAAKSYHLAEKLAAETHQTKLESIADVNEAALQTKMGDLDEAMRLYQHALTLDQTSGDDSSAAQDWLLYGRFLNDAGFSPRLAYACLVKAEATTKSLSNPDVPPVLISTRRQLEQRLGASAEAIRRDPTLTLSQALALHR